WKWPSPKLVTFGNGSKAISEYFVDLGPIMHYTAILNCITNTILAVTPVNRRGYTVSFTHNMRCRITKGNDQTLIIDEPVQPVRNLYYVDIVKLYAYKEPHVGNL
ncbi:MAG: hypothetical protein ACK559_40740, partial [bacterium]